jgi:hypothetical protein
MLHCAVLVAATTALVAFPAGASASCANEEVRKQEHATFLPECRGFEQVSPVRKDDEEVSVPLYNSGYEIQYQAAREGAAAGFQLNGGIPEGKSAAEFISAFASGGAPGSAWTSFPTAPSDRWGSLRVGGPNSAGNFDYYSPNLTCAVQKSVLPEPTPGDEEVALLPAPEKPEQFIENIYVLNTATREYTLVTNAVPKDPGGLDIESDVYFVDGVTSNCQKVVWNEEAKTKIPQSYQLPVAPGSSEYAPEHSIYEWTPQTGVVLASILPDGTAAKEITDLQAGSASNSHSVFHMLSADGSKVYFVAKPDAAEEPGVEPTNRPEEIYLHEVGKPTVSVTKSETATPSNGAAYSGASADGSRVFFRANYGLTARSSEGAAAATSCSKRPGGPAIEADGYGCDLYEYREGKLSDISADLESETGDTHGANVHAVVGISEDGSYVYFAASGRLVTGQGKSGAENETTENPHTNLYVDHDGKLSYIANVPAVEGGGIFGAHGSFEAVDAMDSSAAMTSWVARVSESGQYLLFASRGQLTSYNNLDKNKPTIPDYEYYEYHYTEGAGEVTCVSCNPSGEQPIEKFPGTTPFSQVGEFLEVKDSAPQRNLLNDGRVFFDFYDPIVKEIEKTPTEKVPVSEMVHVYQWIPDGTEGCATAAGCLSILDNGTSQYPSYFEGASADGHNVYFTTPEPLAPRDGDGLRDLYDVRVEGGTLFTEPVKPCDESANKECQGLEGGLLDTTQHESELAKAGNPPLQPPGGKTQVEAFVSKAVAVKSKSHSGSSITLVIAAPGKGKITVSGSGVSTLGKSVTKLGNYTLKLTLGKKAKTAVKHHKKVKVKLRVAFAPSNGKASAVTVTITV